MVKGDPFVTFQLYVYCWWICAPITISLWLITLPKKLLMRCLFGRDKDEPKEANEITVVISEPKGSAKPKDEILLIHGFADSGEMWHS